MSDAIMVLDLDRALAFFDQNAPPVHSVDGQMFVGMEEIEVAYRDGMSVVAAFDHVTIVKERLELLGPDAASYAISFDEAFVTTEGDTMEFSGVWMLVFHPTPDGWRIVYSTASHGASSAERSSSSQPKEIEMEDIVVAANEQLLNQGHVERVPEFFAESYVLHTTDGDVQGSDVIAGFISELRTAFPDLEVGVEVLVAEGHRLAWIRHHRGTHSGEFSGVPATGQELAWQDMVVTRFQDGLIAEEWGVSELEGKLRGI